MYETHYPKADADRLHLQRCEGGRSLVGLEYCVQVEVYIHEKYLSTLKEKILKEVNRSIIIENNGAEEVKKKYIKRIEKNLKKNLFMDSLEKLQTK